MTVSWAAFALAFAIFALLPGPAMMAVIAGSLHRGFVHTLPLIFGIVLGDLIFLTCAVFGLAFLAQTLGEVFLAVKIGGALYLFYLAWKSWTAPLDAAPEAKPATHGKSALTGLALCLANPKVILFYMALLPTFLDPAQLDGPATMLLYGTVTMILMAVLTSYALLAQAVRTGLRTSKARKIVNRLGALTYVGAGVAVATRGN